MIVLIVRQVSASVRGELWELICQKLKDGSALLLYPAENEQGFAMKASGKTDRHLRDSEGLLLVTVSSQSRVV